MENHLQILKAMIDHLDLFLYHRHSPGKVIVFTHLSVSSASFVSVTACALPLLIKTPISVKPPVISATMMFSNGLALHDQIIFFLCNHSVIYGFTQVVLRHNDRLRHAVTSVHPYAPGSHTFASTSLVQCLPLWLTFAPLA